MTATIPEIQRPVASNPRSPGAAVGFVAEFGGRVGMGVSLNGGTPNHPF